MSTWQSVKRALSLLGRKDRRRLVLVAVLQASLALLDLIGLALIGVVAGLAASLMGGSVPPVASSVASLIGVPASDATTIVLLLSGAAAFVLISKSLLSFAITRRLFAFLAKRQASACGEIARTLLNRPLLEVQARSSQETAYALTAGINAAFVGVLGSAVVVLAEGTLLVVLGVGLAAVDWVVCLFTVVFFLLVGLVVHRALAKWAGRLGVTISSTEIASIVSIQDAIRGYRELFVSGRRNNYVVHFQVLRNTAASALADVQVVNLVPKYVFEVMMVVGGGLLVISQLLTRDVTAAIAIIAVYLAAASRIMPSMLRMQSGFITIRNSAGVADATYRLIDTLAENPTPSNDVPLPGGFLVESEHERDSAEVTLSLEGVSFTFPGASTPMIRDISLTVPHGSTLALVGATGAGKSTLVDLAMGVLQPDAGSVRIGGYEPEAFIVRNPGVLSCVPQAVAVIEGTVRENVAFGVPEHLIRDSDIWEALAAAHLSDFLLGQRSGLDTIVGEHGVKLSGGQRQRLGLARALYSKPKVIFLDEATSALDAETERAISSTLQGLAGSVSLILVAHRLATVREADQVAYLEDGRLLALGTFEEVRRQVPDFDRQARLLGL